MTYDLRLTTYYGVHSWKNKIRIFVIYEGSISGRSGHNKKSLFIGIPTETDYQEKRIPLNTQIQLQH